MYVFDSAQASLQIGFCLSMYYSLLRTIGTSFGLCEFFAQANKGLCLISQNH